MNNYTLLKIASSVSISDDVPMYKRPISSTIGRLNSPLYALITGSKHFVQPGPTKEDLEYLADYYENDPDSDIHLGIHPNRARPIENLKRVWKRKDISIPGKLLGTLASPIADTSAALMRADQYNPWAHSTTLFTNDPAINLHEIGHAKDFDDKRKFRTLYAVSRGLPLVSIPATLYQEGKASKNALENAIENYVADLPEEEQDAAIARFNRVLGGGFGSYVGSSATTVLGELGRPLLPITQLLASVGGGATGQLVGRYAQPFGKRKKDKDDSESSDDKE